MKKLLNVSKKYITENENKIASEPSQKIKVNVSEYFYDSLTDLCNTYKRYNYDTVKYKIDKFIDWKHRIIYWKR
jgi:hypothetical protein